MQAHVKLADPASGTKNNFIDFGKKTVTFCEAADCEPIPIDQQIHTVTVGLNYKFDWGGGKGVWH